MTFQLSREQEMMRKMVRAFAEKEIAPLAEELDILIGNLSRIRDAVQAGDGGRLSSLLREGRLVKESLGE